MYAMKHRSTPGLWDCHSVFKSVELKGLLRGFINIVNPLGEHSPGNDWPYNESNRVRRTDCYGSNCPSRTCHIRRILNSGLAQSERANSGYR